MELSTINRAAMLDRMAAEDLDLLIIGGGITGAGIAWDASLRGMKTGLVEMKDFSWGTSSRSTKLVHGGLRYLKQGEVKLVREVGRERALLHRLAPHIVVPAPMVLPIYEGGSLGYFSTSIGLAVYDWLAGVKRSERRRMYKRGDTLALEPLLKPEGLKGSGYYYEYRTDDSRLTLEVLKTAHANGASISNYAKAEAFLYREGRLIGVKVRDTLSGGTREIKARVVVNAAGPWVDGLRSLDRSLRGKRLRLTKGVHLVVDYRRFPLKQAAYFDVPGGRMIFVIPRGNKTYIGTTDTVYEGRIEDPRVSWEDIEYLLASVNAVFPAVRLRAEDIESGWAGLRPLIYEEGKDPSEISRKDEVIVSESGLITIAGGKLTGFRKMAQKAVDLAAKRLKTAHGLTFSSCATSKQTLSGGSAGGFESFEACREELIREGLRYGLPESELARLASTYGSNTAGIYGIYEAIGEEAAPDRRLLLAEMIYGLEHEMAVTPADFLVRRTGQVYFDRRRAERLAPDVIAWMADYFGWDEERKDALGRELLDELARAEILHRMIE